MQGYKAGLYFKTQVCMQPFWIFRSVKGLFFDEKGKYSDKNGRSNNKMNITIGGG